MRADKGIPGTDLAVQFLESLMDHGLEILFHRGQRGAVQRNIRNVVIAGDDHIIRHFEAMTAQFPLQPDCHKIIGTDHGLRGFAVHKEMPVSVFAAGIPHVPVKDIPLIIDFNPMIGHFPAESGQAEFTVRVSVITGQERNPRQVMVIQKVPDQGADRVLLIRIGAVKLITDMADSNDRTCGPAADFIQEGFPEAFDFIGIRRHQDSIELFNGRKGKHPALLGVVFILAGEVTDGGENHNIIVQLPG